MHSAGAEVLTKTQQAIRDVLSRSPLPRRDDDELADALRAARVLAESHRSLQRSCIIHSKHIKRSGYGQDYRPNGGGPVGAHILAWERAHDCRLPIWHEIHHRCLNRACVNPDHLECLTIAEHKERHRALRPTCGMGHEFSPENTYTRPKDGARLCKRCRADAQQRHRDRAKLQEVAA